MAKTYRIGTRTSPLALRQVEEVVGKLIRLYPEFPYAIVGVDTSGDRDKVTPLSEIEGTDFFTREIEEALLKGEIDFAVHSAKDLPEEIPAGLVIAAITKSIDPSDALVSKNNFTLEGLPKGARIGASSARRKEQLRVFRRDFQIIDIRGNIEERLSLLDANECVAKHSLTEGDKRQTTNDEQPNLDAVIVAACALVRLGLEERITQRISLDILKPHPWQGSLAIEARSEDRALIDLLKVLNER
jgi:hydroxymethylbilane synthase